MTPRNNYLLATSTWFLAYGMQSVVFAWLVTIVLREPAELVGWAQTALLLPGMLFILLAGVLADRIGPDRQALYAQLAAALIPWLLIAAIYAGWMSFPVMLIYAVLMGLVQAFVTPARDGLLNHVSGSRIQHTVLLTSLCQFGFQIVGYAIAAFADRLGASVVLAMQSFCLLLGVLAYQRIRRSGIVESQPRTTDSVLQSVLQGAKTVAGSPVMRTVVIQNVAMALFFMGCFIVCFPLAVREVFNGSSSSLGLLNGLNSAGLALTILVMLRIGYVKRAGRALLVAQALGSIVLILSGSVESFPVFVMLVFCWGLCGGAAMPMSRTMMQELAPPAQRARVMSFYAFSFMGAGPIGTLFAGYLSELVGPQMAIQICGALMLTVVLLVGLTSTLWRENFEPASAGAG
ncbi:MAG: MFS transporter [bacterium]